MSTFLSTEARILAPNAALGVRRNSEGEFAVCTVRKTIPVKYPACKKIPWCRATALKKYRVSVDLPSFALTIMKFRIGTGYTPSMQKGKLLKYRHTWRVESIVNACTPYSRKVPPTTNLNN